MKTAAAYIRVSDERQDEFSPDSQLKLIRDYCSRNDIELPDELIFYDDGISAKSVKKRTQFNDMIALAKQKEKPFSMILVWKFSRFARNQEESIVYKSLLRKNGVDVISVSEPIQDNPFGGLIERIIEWMDEYYLIRLSDEVRRGMTERATRGLPNSHPPFGYEMVDGKYELKEDEAMWVREIFNMYLSGTPKRTISTHLTSMGVINHYGNPIDLRGVDYILNNPVYNGYVRWNPHNRSSSARKFGESSDIVVKSTHTPIIDDDTWERTQKMIAQNKKMHSKYMRETAQVNMYMLKGLVKCDNCGATLVYVSAGNKGVQCHNYSRSRCNVSHYISLDKLNKMVIAELKKCVTTLSFNIEPKSQPVTAPNMVDYQSLINTERSKLERARQAYQEGVDSLQEYRAAKYKIEQKITSLTEERDKAIKSAAGIDLVAYARTIEQALEIVENPAVTEELKNHTLKTIVEKIIFYRPGNEIEIYFH